MSKYIGFYVPEVPEIYKDRIPQDPVSSYRNLNGKYHHQEGPVVFQTDCKDGVMRLSVTFHEDYLPDVSLLEATLDLKYHKDVMAKIFNNQQDLKL